MKKLALIKSTGEIVDELPENHPFSDREKEVFNIKEISDAEIETFNKEISDYYATNEAIGGIEIKGVKKYYNNGKLSWQIV